VFKHPSVLYTERNPLHIQCTDHLTEKERNRIYGREVFLLIHSIKEISADNKTWVFWISWKAVAYPGIFFGGFNKFS